MDAWHGTVGGYTNHKCRCGLCRAAYLDYRRERRRLGYPKLYASKAHKEGRVIHGTINGYATYLCRCAECTEAMRVYQAERRRRIKNG